LYQFLTAITIWNITQLKLLEHSEKGRAFCLEVAASHIKAVLQVFPSAVRHNFLHKIQLIAIHLFTPRFYGPYGHGACEKATRVAPVTMEQPQS
jgi:hypothetical protein